MNTQRIRNRKPLYMMVFLSASVIALEYFGVRINITPSMPMGLYVSSTRAKIINRGDTVLACLSEPYKSLGLNSHYIGKGVTCLTSEALIKQVIAVPGDRVTLADRYLLVNGKVYYYQTSYFDSNRRALAVFPRGMYVNTNGYWLIGTHALKSWDSRYWGPVSTQQILTVLKPVLTW